MADQITEAGGVMNTAERPEPFLPTPERVSGILDELKMEEVIAQMKSVQGRKDLLSKLMEHEDEIRQQHGNFNPEAVRAQLDVAGEALLAEETYLREVRSPEKKSLFGHVWETVSTFPRKHPYLTILLAAAAVGAGASYLGFLPSLSSMGLGIGRSFGWVAEEASGAAESAAAAGADAATGAGLEAAADAAGTAFTDISIVDHSILYNGESYTMDAFKTVLEQLKSNPDAALRIVIDPSARATTETELFKHLMDEGIPYKYQSLDGVWNRVPLELP